MIPVIEGSSVGYARYLLPGQTASTGGTITFTGIIVPGTFIFELRREDGHFTENFDITARINAGVNNLTWQ
jgi:hypothetical protein